MRGDTFGLAFERNSPISIFLAAPSTILIHLTWPLKNIIKNIAISTDPMFVATALEIFFVDVD